MSLVWLESKYVSLISFRLRNFKNKGQHKWNFSCPFCGDSKTNRSKARGYVFPYKGKLFFKCQKCSVPLTVPNFIKALDLSLYDEYVKESLLAAGNKPVNEITEFVEKLKPQTFHSQSPLNKLRKISQLKADHSVKLYVEQRMIPSEYHYKLYLTTKFKTWVNSFIPDKFESVEKDEPRLVIPFIDSDGKLFGFQGRSFRKNSPLRYITIMLEEKPKIFGIDTLDMNEHIYVVEGPIDSMFLPNCIASAGGDICSNLTSISSDRRKFTIVYDNEPRHIETCKKIDKAIDKGYNVCIWPDNFSPKDINDAVLSGLTSDQIKTIIDDNSTNGLRAKIKFSMWKRV